MKKYKNIAEVKNACESGEIDESKLKIQLDNNITSFFKGDVDSDGDPVSFFDAGGHDDVDEVFKIAFPKAKVDWC